MLPSYIDGNRAKAFESSFPVDMVPMTAVFAAPKVEPDMLGFTKTFQSQVTIKFRG